MSKCARYISKDKFANKMKSLKLNRRKMGERFLTDLTPSPKKLCLLLSFLHAFQSKTHSDFLLTISPLVSA